MGRKSISYNVYNGKMMHSETNGKNDDFLNLSLNCKMI